MDRYLGIKKRYEYYYQQLLQKGQFLFKDTKDGSWGVSITEEVYTLFQKINLEQFSSFLDLGSGDGKVVLISSLFVKNATGIESDRELYEMSIKINEELHIQNTTFLNENYHNHDFSQYNVLYILPDKPFHRGLQEKVEKELQGILIVYGNHFAPNLPIKEQHTINGTTIIIYEQHS
jgi:hypothetical protein